MDAKQLTRQVEPERKPRRSGLLVAAGAFAVVVALAFGLAIVLNSPSEDVTPATSPTTTIDAAPTTEATTPTTTDNPEASVVSAAEMAVLGVFVDAVNSADPEAIEAVLAPEFAMTTSEPNRNEFSAPADAAALLHAYYAAEGSSYSLSDCAATEAGIRCTSTWSGIVPMATFGVDLTGEELVVIADGMIQSIHHTPRMWPSTLPWLNQGRLDLIEWVRTISPDDAMTMESGSESYLGFRLEVAPLWESYAEQWLAAGRP